MTPLDIAARLDRLAQALAEEPDADRQWLAGCLRGLLEGDGFEAAAGLASGVRGAGWRTKRTKAQHRRLLLKLAQHYQDEPNPRSKVMSAELNAYACRGWPIDRACGGPQSSSVKRGLMYQLWCVDRSTQPAISASTIYGLLVENYLSLYPKP